MALTRRQRQVLDVVRELIDKNGYSPSLEEIGRELGLSSVATVHKHVSHLVQKGYVRRTWNQNRSIELVDPDERQKAVQVPLSGTLSVGKPLDPVPTAETVNVPAEMVKNPSASYALRVLGDTLAEELIRDGDYVVIERRGAVHDGETVVAVIEEGGATLKRFRRDGAQVRLEPANPRMQPIVLDSNLVRIQGVVVGVIRKF